MHLYAKLHKESKPKAIIKTRPRLNTHSYVKYICIINCVLIHSTRLNQKDFEDQVKALSIPNSKMSKTLPAQRELTTRQGRQNISQ